MNLLYASGMRVIQADGAALHLRDFAQEPTPDEIECLRQHPFSEIASTAADFVVLERGPKRLDGSYAMAVTDMHHFFAAARVRGRELLADELESFYRVTTIQVYEHDVTCICADVRFHDDEKAALINRLINIHRITGKAFHSVYLSVIAYQYAAAESRAYAVCKSQTMNVWMTMIFDVEKLELVKFIDHKIRDIDEVTRAIEDMRFLAKVFDAEYKAREALKCL